MPFPGAFCSPLFPCHSKRYMVVFLWGATLRGCQSTPLAPPTNTNHSHTGMVGEVSCSGTPQQSAPGESEIQIPNLPIMRLSEPLSLFYSPQYIILSCVISNQEQTWLNKSETVSGVSNFGLTCNYLFSIVFYGVRLGSA